MNLYFPWRFLLLAFHREGSSWMPCQTFRRAELHSGIPGTLKCPRVLWSGWTKQLQIFLNVNGGKPKAARHGGHGIRLENSTDMRPFYQTTSLDVTQSMRKVTENAERGEHVTALGLPVCVF